METIGVISVPDQILSPHKITQSTQQYFDKIIKKIDQAKKSKSLPSDYYSIIHSIYRGRLQCQQAGCFHVTVSDALLVRALNLLNALVIELEKHGFKIQSMKNKEVKGPVVAIKDNEVITFMVSEGYKYQVAESSQKMTELDRLMYPDKKPVATGKLTFSVYASEAHLGRSWTDGKRLIELELPSIIHEFISLVPRQKQAKIDELARQELRKEETRIFRERESRRYLEQSIYKEALQESELFKLHKQLESYLNYLEVQYLEKYGIFNEQALAWILTARKIANANNPVSRRLEIFGNE